MDVNQSSRNEGQITTRINVSMEAALALSVCNGDLPREEAERPLCEGEVLGAWERHPQAKRSPRTMPRWQGEGTFLQVKVGGCG